MSPCQVVLYTKAVRALVAERMRSVGMERSQVVSSDK